MAQVSTVQEDKMKEFITMAHYPELNCQCDNGGCSGCEPQNNTLQFASGKEIEEFYNNYSEAMYVDPAEMELPECDK